MPKFKNEQIGIRVSSDLRRRLETIASFHQRSLSDFIRLELEKIVKYEESELFKGIDDYEENVEEVKRKEKLGVINVKIGMVAEKQAGFDVKVGIPKNMKIGVDNDR